MAAMIATCSFPSFGKTIQGQACGCSRRGFTLVEMLVVLAIIGILSALSASAISGIKGAADFNSAVAQISGVMDQARAYAMAKHTYVYVGFTEVDAAQAPTANPQTPGTGRVAVLAVATADGTRGFDANTSWMTTYNTPTPSGPPGSNLVAIAKPLFIQSLHFVSQTQPLSSTGNMSRPALTSNQDDLISQSSYQTQTPLAWPLGKPLKGGQYNFNQVIYFDPQGACYTQSQSDTTVGQIDPYLELDLQPTHGDAVPPTPGASAANVAAIQIDGMTGAIRVYRP